MIKLNVILNICLRGATLASKFVLIFALVRFLDPNEVGLYGLFSATVGYGLMILGFDFYTFSTREIISARRAERATMVRDQLFLFSLIYIVMLPVTYLIFANDLMPSSVAKWFFFILIFEHLAQEINRLLVALQEQIWASIVLFIRFGAWGIVAVAVLVFIPNARSLDFIFLMWLLAVVGASVLGGIKVFHMVGGTCDSGVNWRWIREGLKVAFPFFVGTLALRALYTVDRYWINHIGGLEIVAVYTFFMGICNALSSFLEAGVFSFLYPAIVESVSRHDGVEYGRLMKKMTLQTIFFLFVLTFCCVALVEVVLQFVGKGVYIQYVGIFYLQLISVNLFVLSMIPHYSLYAFRKDRLLLIGNLVLIVSFILCVALLEDCYNVYAVSIGMCFAVGILFVLKIGAYFLYCNSIDCKVGVHAQR